MKKCQKCGYENDDSMRFCLECGTLLPNSPIVINWQDGGTQKQSNADTASFGQSMETRIGSGGAGANFPNNLPAAAAAAQQTRPRRNKKLFIVIGGIAALFLLVLAAGAAIIGYNLIYPSKPVVYNPTPTASPTRSNEKTPKPSPSKSPGATPTAAPSETPEPTPAGEAKTEFDRIWVDYNVSDEEGRVGMRIHVDCSVKNMKGVSSYLALYFRKKDGTKLLSSSRNFRSKDGQLALYKALKPAYDNAVYEDSEFFMPYEEFNLKRGTHDLQIDVDLIYENGDFIEHMTLYDFEYEKK
ncbi:MAG TPA: zinc-ribbon domain-containing protein [Pyrinomonadaceae bacterium]|nr:zinc-ribbon domain-containing protein [Pyrinomonadaceae bacterium]